MTRGIAVLLGATSRRGQCADHRRGLLVHPASCASSSTALANLDPVSGRPARRRPALPIMLVRRCTPYRRHGKSINAAPREAFAVVRRPRRDVAVLRAQAPHCAAAPF
ncbi:MAG: hypothetical protein U5N53_12865 [Mycobacterium sp.]|nr:hypothetical protein [Mycobacterium sp.]